MRIRRTLIHATLLAAASSSAPTAAFAAPARPAAAPARLSQETLVPTEVFPAEDGKKFAYPNGFDVVYTRGEAGHVWKLTEKSVAMEAPAPTPGASPSPAPEVTLSLAPTAAENEFLANVGLVRPTFVTITFLDSAQTANSRVEDFFTTKGDEIKNDEAKAAEAKAKGTAYATVGGVQFERDAKLAPGAVIYGREFNLGEKNGGVRRGFTILLAKGSTLLRIDADLGLKDGRAEADIDTLEKRARAVAAYVMKKL